MANGWIVANLNSILGFYLFNEKKKKIKPMTERYFYLDGEYTDLLNLFVTRRIRHKDNF